MPSRQAPTKPDRMAGAHQPSLPGAQPGKNERYQLNFTLVAPGLEVCCETIRIVFSLDAQQFTTSNERIEQDEPI